MATFSDEQLLAFQLGEEVDCTSSNVQTVQYDADQETFIVGFGKPEDATLSFYTYPGVPQGMADDFAAAPSKGKWVYANFRRPKWDFVRGIEGVRKLHRQSAG